jgi:hypothetical protein
MDDPTSHVDAPRLPLRFRRTRIVASVFFAAVTVSLCVLWVRSFWWVNWVQVDGTSGKGGHIAIGISKGEAVFQWMSLPDFGNCDIRVGSREATAGTEFDRAWLGFLITSRPYLLVVCPFWFLVLSFGMLAIIAMQDSRRLWRFSLRTMFIATTLLAAVLGLVVWLAF